MTIPSWLRASAFLFAVASTALLGCGATQRPPAATAPVTTSTASEKPIVAPGDAKIGDRTRCPVSGEEFVVDADSPKAEYAGKTYYLCCTHCAAKFNADPKAYTAPAK